MKSTMPRALPGATGMGTPRRAFLKFLAGSPLWAAGPALAHDEKFAEYLASSFGWESVRTAADAVNVFDLRDVARNTMPPAHYGQVATGGGSERTLRRNREAFDFYGVHARRMIGVGEVDTGVELFGTRMPGPIMLSPAGSHNMVNQAAGGERATARGAASRGATMMLSTFTTTGIEEVAEAYGGPVWYQLYPNTQWRLTESLVRRAERAGSPVIVCTVDGVGGMRSVTNHRARLLDQRNCQTCHEPDQTPFRKSMFNGLDVSDAGQLGARIDMDFIHRLRDTTDRRLVIKGIMAAEDAVRAIEAGADGIVVSNHGGRGGDAGVSSIEVLEEIVEAVGGRVPVLIDSGFRRGTDVFKALALGATAVCIGRPYLWGLGAFGEEGVAAALNLMTAEFEQCMRHAGTVTTAEITGATIRRL